MRFGTKTLPCCGKLVDAATIISTGKDHGAADVMPKTGDFTICIYCGSWLRFTDDDGTQRKFDPETDFLDVTDEQREMMRQATALVHEAHTLFPTDFAARTASKVIQRRRPPGDRRR